MLKERILVVEDEVIIAQDIQRTLTKLGYFVPTFVISAEAALDRITELRPDLVLMDIHLSGNMDGIAAASEIRRRAHVPVVFLTAHSDEATLSRAQLTEPFGYVLKPFEERELQITIDIALYRHRIEAQLKKMERWLATTLKSIGDGVVATGLDGTITFMNRMAEELTGWPQAEALGKPLAQVLRLVDAATRAEAERLIERVLDRDLIIDTSPDTLLINRDGAGVPVDNSAAPILGDNGEVTGAVVVFRDVSARKCMEDKLRHLATHDMLTGLTNRNLLLDRLRMAFEHGKRAPDYRFALLFIDLDRFKIINDSLGHLFGDQVLITAAKRLSQCVRSEDTLARLGGDEFVILASRHTDLMGAIRIANRIIQRMAAPITVEGQDVFTSASIGIVLSGPHYTCPNDLMRDADAALYRAKTEGRARFSVFDDALHAKAVRLLQLETELRRAAEYREFSLYYQPIVALTTGRLYGFEALLRWRHPERGLLAPADFIALAEETGLLARIGGWVLKEACGRLQRWQASHAALSEVSIAVNLSKTQFLHPGLCAQVGKALTLSGLRPHCLVLEISESIVADRKTAEPILDALHALGVQVRIDDFGTGYASLNMMQHAPIDAVKIDRGFVQSLEGGGEKDAVIRAILTLIGEFGLEAIAEGIEKTEYIEHLLSWGCIYGQGYLFAEPMSEQETDAYIQQLNSPSYAPA